MRAAPKITSILVNRIAFHFPILATGPLNIAPQAEPSVQALVIIVDHFVFSEVSKVEPSTGSTQLKIAEKGSYNVLNTPIE